MNISHKLIQATDNKGAFMKRYETLVDPVSERTCWDDNNDYYFQYFTQVWGAPKRKAIDLQSTWPMQ